MSEGRRGNGQFEKGNNGRPKGSKDKQKGVKQIIDDYMAATDPKKDDDLSRWHHLVAKIYDEAMNNGNARSAIYLIDRKLGKPMQEIKVGGGKPIDAAIHFHVNGTIERIPDGDDGR